MSIVSAKRDLGEVIYTYKLYELVATISTFLLIVKGKFISFLGGSNELIHAIRERQLKVRDAHVRLEAVVLAMLPWIVASFADRFFGYDKLFTYMLGITIWFSVCGLLGVINGIARIALLARR